MSISLAINISLCKEKKSTKVKLVDRNGSTNGILISSFGILIILENKAIMH